jgi:hypothetical protein
LCRLSESRPAPAYGVGERQETADRSGQAHRQGRSPFALTFAGQDADFLLEKHAPRGRGEENEGLPQGRMSPSRYHRLRRHELLGVTSPDRRETFFLSPPNSVINSSLTLPDLAVWRKQEEAVNHPPEGNWRRDVRGRPLQQGRPGLGLCWQGKSRAISARP